ncbi:hypothetical protein DMA11_11175 [Marinilabiliaceae bacterium JC017]|nr:hypothetical protein DMA11_11175 [Marinilabiliaceae bacterium JC017]
MKKNNLNRLFTGILLLLTITVSAQHHNHKKKKIYSSAALKDNSLWKVEQQPGGQVLFTKQGIELLDSSGCTVWFKPQLEGPLMIEYKIKAVDKGGPYDRVSDMNVFWMATAPQHPDDLFHTDLKRQGQFRQYDGLLLYYVGCGGHNNTKTRFRRYNGTNNRPLLEGHDLDSPDVLLTPNKTYTVRLIANQGKIRYIRDGKTIFSIDDPKPYTKGWFGFRVYKSHQIISGFKVFRLQE